MALSEMKVDTPPGGVAEPAKVRAREDAMIRNALAEGKVAVVIAGAAHDLGTAAQRVSEGKVEVVTITTRTVKELVP